MFGIYPTNINTKALTSQQIFKYIHDNILYFSKQLQLLQT